ncbi:Tetratricopeptide repeat superfamily protein isoform 1 [Hibiscus syriacus]|uniref:MLO-like protein n=1 Tax=Hibiscus syriacus TaxID=106335 RepID=A0A6A2YVR6_HIBSY|nr:Tetratricopeptide repeat superfamily protein isoform 1 [Hibiscus syriacus]
MSGGVTTLEYTPTWVVAVVCFVIVFISLAVERLLHFLGKYLKKRNQKPLFEALQKIKEELMLLGFISLLLTVFQESINKICMSSDLADRWLPCREKNGVIKEHFQTLFSSFHPGGIGRRLLAEASDPAVAYWYLFYWESSIVIDHSVAPSTYTHLRAGGRTCDFLCSNYCFRKRKVVKTKNTQVQEHDFIRNRFLGIGKNSELQGWVYSFFKQFYGSVTKSDYITLRLGFIMGNPKFNFHNYMMRALEADFKKVVGISWYLWAFVVIFMLLNFVGKLPNLFEFSARVLFLDMHLSLDETWNYGLLLAVGTKLEYIITQLAQEVQYDFHSGMMGQVRFIIPRLIIGVLVQFVCGYSTLPLFAFFTQMGSSYKKAIFDEHIREGLVGWAKKAKKNKGIGFKRSSNESKQVSPREESPLVFEMQKVNAKESSSSSPIYRLKGNAVLQVTHSQSWFWKKMLKLRALLPVVGCSQTDFQG